MSFVPNIAEFPSIKEGSLFVIHHNNRLFFDENTKGEILNFNLLNASNDSYSFSGSEIDFRITSKTNYTFTENEEFKMTFIDALVPSFTRLETNTF